MKTCNAVKDDLASLAVHRPAELPEWVRDHVAACPECTRRLAAARLARELVAAGADALVPPNDFADRVRTALAARSDLRRAEPDAWWSAWGLLPTFAAAVAALVIVYQTSEVQTPIGLFSTEGLSAGEHMLLDSSAPDDDDVLTAVLEGVGR